MLYCRWGLGALLRWWPPSTIYGHHQGCLNNPIFSSLGLYAACCTHFMCPHELWPTSVSHPFSPLYSSLGFAEGKHHQKISIPIFRLLQNFAIPSYFPYILFYHYLFSLTSSGLFIIAVCGSISVREYIDSSWGSLPFRWPTYHCPRPQKTHHYLSPLTL